MPYNRGHQSFHVLKNLRQAGLSKKNGILRNKIRRVLHSLYNSDCDKVLIDENFHSRVCYNKARTGGNKSD